MHPDAIIKGLRRELASVPKDDTNRRAAIEAEIIRVDGLPRPRIAPELSSFAVADKDRELLLALRRELERAGERDEERRRAVSVEIERVEAMIARRVHGDQVPSVEPQPEPEPIEPKSEGESSADTTESGDEPGE